MAKRRQNGTETPAEAQPVPARTLSVQLPRWQAWVVAGLLLAPSLLVVLLWVRSPWRGAGGGASPLPPLSAGALIGKPGPWGDLEYVPIQIAPPAEFVPEMSMPSATWRWVFPGMTAEALRVFLTKLEVPSALREEILSTSTAVPEVGGCAVAPAAEAVRALPQEARRRIYVKLGESDLNVDQVNAYRIREAEFEGRIQGMVLPDPVKALVRGVSYQQGRFRFFADLRLALPLVPEMKDRAELVTNLAQTSTMVVRLRVGKNSDIRALTAYWGRGGRAKDFEPLLESLARHPGGQAIDINHLLPSFPRRRIYTFPRPTSDPVAARRDCHWAAFNFFAEQPDDRFTDFRQVRQAIEANCTTIHTNPMLGDLVLLAKPDGMLWHSGIYIADDIVFTKNGRRVTSPFVFMRLEDMKDFYASDPPLVAHFMRPNELAFP